MNFFDDLKKPKVDQLVNETFPFTEEVVKQYLNERIKKFKDISKRKDSKASQWYADILQNMRDDFFGSGSKIELEE